jgi:hypothetical protein
MVGDEELKIRFTYHEPKSAATVGRYVAIREAALDYAEMIDEFCPDCRETSLAITKLEEVVMWANAAMARRT